MDSDLSRNFRDLRPIRLSVVARANACGYTLLNAAYYGVPQMRERLFLIGYRREIANGVAFPEPTHWVDLPPGYEGSRAVALKLLRGTDAPQGASLIASNTPSTASLAAALSRPVPTARRSAISRLFMPSSLWPRGGGPRYPVGRAVAESDYHELPSAREARPAEFRLPVVANARSMRTAAALVFPARAARAGLVAAHLAPESRRVVAVEPGLVPGAAPAALPDLPGLGRGVQIAHELRDHSGRKPVALVLGLFRQLRAAAIEIVQRNDHTDRRRCFLVVAQCDLLPRIRA